MTPELLPLACPTCAANDGGGAVVGVLIGGMILLPFVVTWIVARVVRRL